MPSTFLRLMLRTTAGALALAASPCLAQQASAERTAPDRIDVRWEGIKAADVLRADGPEQSADHAVPVSTDDRDGHEAITLAPATRGYFLIRDRATGKVMHVAERLVPLEQGSNFRDIGGYPAVQGRTVRWGMIYRSGATPLLTATDLRTVGALGLRAIVDLRSDEERQIAPTVIDGVRYNAIGYGMAALFQGSATPSNGPPLYRTMPALLAPQVRLVFDLLKRGEGPIEYNCSAGQDRTGFVTAMVLTALGTPRDTILQDFLTSTKLRRPEFEMAKIDPAAYPGNFAARLFAGVQANPQAAKPKPLVDADGQPLLLSAFGEIEKRWGSVDGYLRQEIGLTDADFAALRARYTE